MRAGDLASIHAPARPARGRGALTRQFPTGGGRDAAAASGRVGCLMQVNTLPQRPGILSFWSRECEAEETMFDSPLHFCERCKQYVALDQSRRECAREQDCRVATCPLERHFVGVDHPLLAESERAKGKED